MLHHGICIYLFCFFVMLANGEQKGSIFVNNGGIAKLSCFDEKWTKSAEGLYVDLYFKLNENSQSVSIARYRPSSNTTKVYPDFPSPQGRLKFFKNGQVHIEQITLRDEGKYECVSNDFNLPAGGLSWFTNVTVYVPPTVKVMKLIESMRADTGLVNAAKCEALGGKPDAKVRWSSPRNFEISVDPSIVNSNANGLSDVSSVLQLSPTRFYDKEEFLCEIAHLSFNQTVVKRIVVDVTYHPVSVKIQVDADKKYLTCSAEGNPPVAYKWITPQNQVVVGDKIEILNPKDPARLNDTYICTAENSIGTKTVNITTFDAIHDYEINNPSNVGLIIGIIIGVLLLIAVVCLGYFFYFRKFRKDDKGPYPPQRATLLRQSTEKPAIQHANDSLNKNRPPSPSQPPPDHENDDHHSSSDDSDEGNHDVDLDTQVLTQYEHAPDDEEGITSRSSVNFRARRQRPSASPTSRRSRAPPMQEQADDAHPTMRYDVPPGDNEQVGYSYEHEDYPPSGQRYNNDTYPHHQPSYVDYPAGDARTNPQHFEPKYSEIDHSGYKRGSDPRRMQPEEPVEYAQIRHGPHIV